MFIGETGDSPHDVADRKPASRQPAPPLDVWIESHFPDLGAVCSFFKYQLINEN